MSDPTEAAWLEGNYPDAQREDEQRRTGDRLAEAYEAALRPIVVAIDNALSAKTKEPYGSYMEQAEKMAPLVRDQVVSNFFAWLGIDPAALNEARADDLTFDQWAIRRNRLIEDVAEGASSGQAGIADVLLMRYVLIPRPGGRRVGDTE
jgi:hypothetical protein